VASRLKTNTRSKAARGGCAHVYVMARLVLLSVAVHLVSPNLLGHWFVRGVSHAFRASAVRGGAIVAPPLPASLNLTVHEGVLTDGECGAIMDLASPHLTPSRVGRPPREEPGLRISLSCRLPRLPVPEL